jgi:hypothetical protein
MPDITCATYVTTDAPDGPLPAVGSVPVPAQPRSGKAGKGSRLVPSYFPDFLIGWYGSTTLQQISEARRTAISKNQTLYRIDVVVDGADYAPTKQLKGQLGRLGVLHADQLPKETEDFLIEQLSIRRTRESGSHVLSDFIWKHPARLGDFWKIPGLSRLNGVIFSAASGEGDARVYYAAIHPRRIKQIRPPPNYPHSVELKLDV